MYVYGKNNSVKIQNVIVFNLCLFLTTNINTYLCIYIYVYYIYACNSTVQSKKPNILFSIQGFHSIVLLATCDAFYKFTYIDVGAYGSEGDANIFKNSTFGSRILNDQLPFPADTIINGKKVPHFIVADDAFPLNKRIIKPFSKKSMTKEERIFNYRLSRARRCIENAFGILSTKWLCLRKVLFCFPDRAQEIVSACCLLHNFLLNKACQEYCPDTFSGYEGNGGEWIRGEYESWEETRNEPNFCRGRSSDYGKYVRNLLKEYVNSEEELFHGRMMLLLFNPFTPLIISNVLSVVHSSTK